MKKYEEMLEAIEKTGIKSIGQKEMVKHLHGEHLSIREMVLAKCYDCMGGYHDGIQDCGIQECALYPLQPYRKGEKYVTKVYSPEVKEKMAARARQMQANRSAARHVES